MAQFQLVDDEADFRGVTLAEYVMACHDVITEDEAEWSDDWNGVLEARSALEFVRGSLPAARAAILDQADAFWKAHPQEFNRFARYQHARKDVKAQLQGWVEGPDGLAPEIPKAHWWWWPLAVAP